MKYFLLIFLSLNLYSIECERAKDIEKCYGECGSFVDLNNNSICDLWENYHKNFKVEDKDLRNDDNNIYKKEVIKTKVSTNSLNKEVEDKNLYIKNNIKNTSIEIKTSESKSNKKIKETFKDKIMRFGILWIFVINIILVIGSEIFAKNNNFIRILWNWIFLISFVICSLSGFFIYFGILKDFKLFFYKLHMQSSIVLTVIALYHTIKRFRCMI